MDNGMRDVTEPVKSWMPMVTYFGAAGVPDLVVARLAGDLAAAGGGEWKVWICEADSEYRSLMKALAEPLERDRRHVPDFEEGPDAFLRAAVGMAPVEKIVVALYEPPDEGWPYFVLISFPGADVRRSRARYVWEALPTLPLARERIAETVKAMPGEVVTFLPI